MDPKPHIPGAKLPATGTVAGSPNPINGFQLSTPVAPPSSKKPLRADYTRMFKIKPAFRWQNHSSTTCGASHN